MAQTSSPLIEFSKISKTFGAVAANRDVTFSVHSSTIHGVVGENGAGKSTIMKILYGMFEPDHGVISLKGKPTPIRTPQEAITLGIGMVHQHFMLVPTLTVWENIILGKEPSLWFVDEASVMGQLENLKKEFGFQVELNQKVETLSVGHQQQVELLKLLFRKSDILILDEPTAVLSPQEVESLFERLKNLKKAGKTIILITHKLKEILNHTDCVTIMRQGTVVETLATRDLSEEILAEKMIGHKRSPLKRHEEAHTPQAKLQVSSLTLKKPMGQKLSDISFEVNAGEIVGIAGIEGNGQQELIKCLAGIERHFDGQIVFNNQNILDVDSYDLKQMGFSIIPPDRHREAVILPFSISENAILGHHKEREIRNGWFLSGSKTEPIVSHMIQRFDVRPKDPHLSMVSLSGGNQQKLVVARETSRPVQFLLAAHPTRGIDIGAIDFIHQHFLELKSKGTGILLISSELDEILKLSDRILVLFHGRIVAQFTKETANERELGLSMTGGTV